MDETRARLLDAAATLLVSPEYPVLKAISLREAAELAAVPERTARRIFDADSFREATIEHVLRIRESVDIEDTEILAVSRPACDRSRPLLDVLMSEAEFFFDHARSNDLLRAALMLWPSASGNSQISESLGEIYERWRLLISAAINDVLVDHAEHATLQRDWLSVDETASVLTAIIEGLVVQATVLDLQAERNGEPGFEITGKTVGRVWASVISSMLDVGDGTGPLPSLTTLEHARKP